MRIIKLLLFTLVIVLLLLAFVEAKPNNKARFTITISAKLCSDADHDGYGKSRSLLFACPKSTSSYDCNDNDKSINPKAREICGNKVDDNCNQKIDEAGCLNINLPKKALPSPKKIPTIEKTIPSPIDPPANNSPINSPLNNSLPRCTPEKIGFGSMEWGVGKNNSKMTLTAPHGTFDIRTGMLVKNIIQLYSTNYVIASNYQNSTHRLNVNRPTENGKGGMKNEVPSEQSQAVYNAFNDCVSQYEQQYYIEIHGNSNPKTTREIQVATRNVSIAQAQQLVASFNLYKQGKLDEYELKIEPLHKIRYNAGQNKKVGMLSHCDNICLHIELPRGPREKENIDKTAEVLAAWFKDLAGSTVTSELNESPDTNIINTSVEEEEEEEDCEIGSDILCEQQ